MKSLLFSTPILIALGLYPFLNAPLPASAPLREPATISAKANAPEQAPVLSAEAAIQAMQVEEGFEVRLVAAEPLVQAPVTMTFDARGRLWVVEMPGYMPDTVGTGEDVPNGKVVILEDRNGDGRMDHRKVFLDSLVLPRAICLLENGVLVGASPNLYYVPMKNDVAGKKILIDDHYNEGGNVEHNPNGLLRALDNWIYNAKSSKRYRKVGDKWLIEKTHFRGQWGISQDDQGRLYYNVNSYNLQGDYFTPGLGMGNPDQNRVPGYHENIIRDNRVYPIRPTPGVNRGYMEGVLDQRQRLVNFTAACAPLVYRGDLFGPAYAGNVFVAEPAANLIKRNILEPAGNLTRGRQAYANKEFLASTDERFRPVNLFNGPDGALYVVDMYRGIIQHKAFLTPYLKGQIRRRELTQPLSLGRIYKVVPKDKKNKTFRFPAKPKQLVKLLAHPSGYVRDQAQQMLVDKKSLAVVPALRAYLREPRQPLAAAHALWTLEGLGALQTSDVLPLLQHPDWTLRMQALSVLPGQLSPQNYSQYLPALQQLTAGKDALAAPYIAFLSRYFRPFNPEASESLLQAVVAQFPDDQYVAGAAVSSLHQREEAFLKQARTWASGERPVVLDQLERLLESRESKRLENNPAALAAAFPRGAAIFKTTCAPCHGADGNGIASLSPPLNRSEWVTGDKKRLISIVLYGLTGPVQVNGKLYKAPEINGDMPGIGQNKDFSDEDIAQLLSYIRLSWNNKATAIKASDIGRVREQQAGRNKTFTMAELRGL